MASKRASNSSRAVVYPPWPGWISSFVDRLRRRVRQSVSAGAVPAPSPAHGDGAHGAATVDPAERPAGAADPLGDRPDSQAARKGETGTAAATTPARVRKARRPAWPGPGSAGL